jgi:hypothetical protein
MSSSAVVLVGHPIESSISRGSLWRVEINRNETLTAQGQQKARPSCPPLATCQCLYEPQEYSNIIIWSLDASERQESLLIVTLGYRNILVSLFRLEGQRDAHRICCKR